MMCAIDHWSSKFVYFSQGTQMWSHSHYHRCPNHVLLAVLSIDGFDRIALYLLSRYFHYSEQFLKPLQPENSSFHLILARNSAKLMMKHLLARNIAIHPYYRSVLHHFVDLWSNHQEMVAMAADIAVPSVAVAPEASKKFALFNFSNSKSLRILTANSNSSKLRISYRNLLLSFFAFSYENDYCNEITGSKQSRNSYFLSFLKKNEKYIH